MSEVHRLFKYIYTIHGWFNDCITLPIRQLYLLHDICYFYHIKCPKTGCMYNVCESNANRTKWRFSTQTCTPWFVTYYVRLLSNNDSMRLRRHTRLREKDNIQRREIYSVTWHKQTIIHSLRHWDWYQRYKMKSDYYWLIVYHHTRLRWLIRKTWLSHVSYSERTLSWLTLFT